MVEPPETCELNSSICYVPEHEQTTYGRNVPRLLIHPGISELSHKDINDISDYDIPFTKLGNEKYYELRLENYAIVDLHRTTLDEVLPTFKKTVRNGYLAVGTLRHKDQEWSMLRYVGI